MLQDQLPGRLVKLLAEQCYGLERPIPLAPDEKDEELGEEGILHAWGPMAPHPVLLRKVRRHHRRATLPDDFFPPGADRG